MVGTHPIECAVNKWVHAAFLAFFAALSLLRFDGESHPSDLPLTPAIGMFFVNNILQYKRKLIVKSEI